MGKEISSTDDIIDSRDVITRIEELTEERDDLAETMADVEQAFNTREERADDVDDTLAYEQEIETAQKALAEWEANYAAELAALESLQSQAEGYTDWKYGVTLIRDSYFQDYAQQLAEDIGAIDKAASWPNTCIDWKQAASELQQDYTSVDFNGVTYWVQ